MHRSLIVVALVLAWAPGAGADPGRPWPAHWPIVMPPAPGPFALPPLAPRRPPATRSGARVMELVERVRSSLRDTRYQHQLLVRERTGTYRWDCSLMTDWILERAAPHSVRHLDGVSRPLAEHFVRTIERAPTNDFRGGWQRLTHIRDVRAGDVFAWRRPPGFPSRNTGHVGFALETPRPVPGLPNGWALRVADATSSGHQDDTRPYRGEGGFGLGTLVFLTDDQGRGTHYGWGGTRSSGYVVTPIVFGRVGP